MQEGNILFKNLPINSARVRGRRAWYFRKVIILPLGGAGFQYKKTALFTVNNSISKA